MDQSESPQPPSDTSPESPEPGSTSPERARKLELERNALTVRRCCGNSVLPTHTFIRTIVVCGGRAGGGHVFRLIHGENSAILAMC